MVTLPLASACQRLPGSGDSWITRRDIICGAQGETTTLEVAIPVGSLAELSNAEAMQRRIVALSREGYTDDQITAELTAAGYRSPTRAYLLPSTVKGIRLKHRIFIQRSQSHPRRIAGYLTVPQIAQMLGISTHWIYDRIPIPFGMIFSQHCLGGNIYGGRRRLGLSQLVDIEDYSKMTPRQ